MGAVLVQGGGCGKRGAPGRERATRMTGSPSLPNGTTPRTSATSVLLVVRASTCSSGTPRTSEYLQHWYLGVPGYRPPRSRGQGSGLRAQGSGFTVQGSGLRV
eukprot:1785386-Rhodomonas_salina.2